MQILSHRGYWNENIEKNSMAAFARSFELGYGTETDFRDLDGSLVISHDPARLGAMQADDFFSVLNGFQRELTIAINIKSDGLQNMLLDALHRHKIENYFLFDMSIPDAIHSIKKGLRVFTRHSDLEKEPSLYEQSAGVWMDSFYDERWMSHGIIKQHLDSGKQVCIVSPELHGRPHLDFWEYLSESDMIQNPDLMICTDIPEEAQNHFKP